MKKFQYLLVFILCFALATGQFFSSCNNGPKSDKDYKEQEDSKKTAEEHNDAKFDNQPSDDAQFMVDAADISYKEINLGKLAEMKAVNSETKALGQDMARDYQKVSDNISVLAAKKNITIPVAMSESNQKEYDNLNEVQGHDFDSKYADMMVDLHKKAIDKFESASKDAQDPDIQAWAANMLPTLRTQLDKAMNVQAQTNKMK